MEKLVWSVEEMSEALGIGLSSAYNLARREDFPSIRVGKRLLVVKDELRKWLAIQATKGDSYGKCS